MQPRSAAVPAAAGKDIQEKEERQEELQEKSYTPAAAEKGTLIAEEDKLLRCSL
jgi:hypothetical protein